MPADLDILKPPSLLSVPAPAKPPQFREFGDAATTRKLLHENVFNAVKNLEPLSNERHTLTLEEPEWADPEEVTKRQRKSTVLGGETLARRLQGTWVLKDNATGAVLQRRRQVIARVPYLTDLGTFIHRGNEYAVANQARLLPGVFARVKDNGELEAHVNTLPGKGLSHRYFLDPAKGIFKIRIGQAEMPLMPLLQTLGVTDQRLREAWGPDLVAANYAKNDSATIKKLADRLLRVSERTDDPGTTRQKLVEAVERMELDPEVTKRTLGKPYARLGADVILDATRKLLAITRGEAEPDDRDHPAFQSFHGPEDLFAERIRRDHSRLRSTLFRKLSLAGSLDRMPSGALTPQVEEVLVGSGLATTPEEINLLEMFDKQTRITRLGEGGIPSTESVPEEARSVQAGHLGYVDSFKTPEDFTAGINLYMARGARKGSDGKIYTQFRDRKGQVVWKNPQEVIDAAVATPDVMRWDTKRVPVIKNGRLAYVPKAEVDYVLPHYEDSFSPLSNLVPFKSMDKGQRASMAARMLTQALPLVHREAPLVQSGLPEAGGTRSFEDEYGRHAGAVHAERPGRVLGYADGVLKVRYDDGQTGHIELYENMPLARKTMLHQTPALQPGARFEKGQLLAGSNYTDDKGAVALGLNVRTAFVPWRGLNYEDAVVVSDSLAERLTSEHAYQHDLEVTDQHKTGKHAFVSLFPAKFDRETLARLDDRGVVRPGTQVHYGEPLILAARERDRAQNKIHKKRQAGYQDESVLWEHHDPGTVTDVVWGKNGPTVVVKAESAMQVGDKLSGRHGNKGVVASILPDDQMPHDQAGLPFELLANPQGTISRTNPGMNVEAMLGKLAAKLGQPLKVPDFEDDRDMTAWAEGLLRQHGIPDLEDIVDPQTGRKIHQVGTGNSFFMKLHHSAESKAQGRGSGGYTQEGMPAKGGKTGCFVGDVLIDCFHPRKPGVFRVDIAAIARTKLAALVVSRKQNVAFDPTTAQVTDWFHYRVSPDELITLLLENGEQLSCTRNHEFRLTDGYAVPAGNLKPGDDLMEAPYEPELGPVGS